MEIRNPHKKYVNDFHMHYSCQYHIVFCTKYRRIVLNETIAKRFKELVLEKQKECKYEVIEQEVMPDHVHLLLDINPRIGVYTTINKIKGYTSRTLRKEFKELRTRLPTLWTRSKFISTVGSVSLETVKRYIEDQKGK